MPVRIPANGENLRNSVVPATIEAVHGDDLVGRPAEERVTA